jgi:hypothetical protein
MIELTWLAVILLLVLVVLIASRHKREHQSITGSNWSWHHSNNTWGDDMTIRNDVLARMWAKKYQGRRVK